MPPLAQHPPLLEAAYRGSVDSAEWFLSDAPIRMYRQFAAANQDDSRLQTLSSAPGGINKIISNWLETRSVCTLSWTSIL